MLIPLYSWAGYCYLPVADFCVNSFHIHFPSGWLQWDPSEDREYDQVVHWWKVPWLWGHQLCLCGLQEHCEGSRTRWPHLRGWWAHFSQSHWSWSNSPQYRSVFHSILVPIPFHFPSHSIPCSRSICHSEPIPYPHSLSHSICYLHSMSPFHVPILYLLPPFHVPIPCPHSMSPFPVPLYLLPPFHVPIPCPHSLFVTSIPCPHSLFAASIPCPHSMSPFSICYLHSMSPFHVPIPYPHSLSHSICYLHSMSPFHVPILYLLPPFHVPIPCPHSLFAASIPFHFLLHPFAASIPFLSISCPHSITPPTVVTHSGPEWGYAWLQEGGEPSWGGGGSPCSFSEGQGRSEIWSGTRCRCHLCLLHSQGFRCLWHPQRTWRERETHSDHF